MQIIMATANMGLVTTFSVVALLRINQTSTVKKVCLQVGFNTTAAVLLVESSI